MLTERLQDALNTQFNYELESANLYLAMAGYTESHGLGGFTNWFMAQYEEELFHAKKIMKFINDRDGRIEVSAVQAPKNSYSCILEAFKETLKHEQGVTNRFYEIMNIALEEKDYATKSFLQWFIDEQVEEEANVSNMISKIKLVKDANANANTNACSDSLGAGLYLLDQEAAQRSFKAANPL